LINDDDDDDDDVFHARAINQLINHYFVLLFRICQSLSMRILNAHFLSTRAIKKDNETVFPNFDLAILSSRDIDLSILFIDLSIN